MRIRLCGVVRRGGRRICANLRPSCMPVLYHAASNHTHSVQGASSREHPLLKLLPLKPYAPSCDPLRRHHPPGHRSLSLGLLVEIAFSHIPRIPAPFAVHTHLRSTAAAGTAAAPPPAGCSPAPGWLPAAPPGGCRTKVRFQPAARSSPAQAPVRVRTQAAAWTTTRLSARTGAESQD